MKCHGLHGLVALHFTLLVYRGANASVRSISVIDMSKAAAGPTLKSGHLDPRQDLCRGGGATVQSHAKACIAAVPGRLCPALNEDESSQDTDADSGTAKQSSQHRDAETNKFHRGYNFHSNIALQAVMTAILGVLRVLEFP